MKLPKPIHPFPARMAPEIALAACQDMESPALVVDPMSGSGTALRVGALLGHHVVGFDLDPLAVLMGRVWLSGVDATKAEQRLTATVLAARQRAHDEVWVESIDSDSETYEYVKSWFAERQTRDLRAIASQFNWNGDSTDDFLKLALSRIIITKDRGASVARDTSHSRPHRWYMGDDFDVIGKYEASGRRLLTLLSEQGPTAYPGRVSQGDARATALNADSVDLVVTSPPYLNAIDYMRGHRLALVWLGYKLSDLRAVRSSAIGAERGMRTTSQDVSMITEIYRSQDTPLSARYAGILTRFAYDLLALVGEIRRVLRPGGRAVLVIGNSFVDGQRVDNAHAMARAARIAGLDLIRVWDRPLPAHKRYLPPPDRPGTLNRRMRTEVVMEFAKSAT